MNVNIPNYCRTHSVTITTVNQPLVHSEPMVIIWQTDGQCSFQHSMTADQARQMAAALIAAAQTIEVEQQRAAG